jgi:hypothetical protein
MTAAWNEIQGKAPPSRMLDNGLTCTIQNTEVIDREVKIRLGY